VKPVWDIFTNLFTDAEGIELQRIRVRPRSPVAVTLIAITCGTAAIGSLFLSADAVYSSNPTVAVWSVKRQPFDHVKRTPRDEFAPDGREGLSTTRLAETFSQLFVPAEAEEPDVDYSFG
jgi:hypothetical protein